MSTITKIAPQPGFQEKFLSSSADIVIGGSGAGVGKTFAELLEPLRHISNPQFGAVFFRRTYSQITNTGGLWDASSKIYPHVGAKSKEMEWLFPSGATVRMSHLQHDKNIYDHQGTEYPLIIFDELTHFSEKQFFYLLSRNRSTCGIKPYIRATCNPDPDSWLAAFLEWWINQETGEPIRDRDGVLRYFTRHNDMYVWGDSREEVLEKAPHLLEVINDPNSNAQLSDLVKSVTFISGSIYDNKELLSKDPSYLANLLSLDEVEKARLLGGNWKVRIDGLSLFDYRAINDLFSNHPIESPNHYITCDAARFGRDLCVIFVWKGWRVVQIVIMYKSEAHEIVAAIEKQRTLFRVPKSRVVVDQDGVGGGAVGLGGYQGFQGGATAKKDQETQIQEMYKNFKTQCAYRAADRVNAGEVAVTITNENIFVQNGDSFIRSSSVKVGGKVVSVMELIKQDLKSFKRKDPDSEGKKQIQEKAEQKILLNGRSPDFGDNFLLREYFELVETEKRVVRRIN